MFLFLILFYFLHGNVLVCADVAAVAQQQLVVPDTLTRILKMLKIRLYKIERNIITTDPSEIEQSDMANITQIAGETINEEWLASFAEDIDELKPINNDGLNQAFGSFVEAVASDAEESIQQCKKTVERFLSLNRIKTCVDLGSGWQGRDVMTNIPGKLRPTVQAFVGRIFAVDPTTNAVVHTGSGMVLPGAGSGNFSNIVTCKHVMMASCNEDVENFKKYKFYFIRSVALSPDTPNGITVNAPSELLKIPHTVGTYYNPGPQTLETGCVHPDALRPFRSDEKVLQYAMEHPNAIEKYQKMFVRYLQYKSRESGGNLVREITAPSGLCIQDGAVICSLKTSFDSSIVKTPVSIMVSTPDLTAQNHHAIGFPESPYIMNGMSMEEWYLCLVQGKTAPITMTTGTIGIPVDSTRYINGFFHNAPTAEGMSGGPILTFEEDVIKLVGVVGRARIESQAHQRYIMFAFH
jgi:hypothetical protein